MSPICLADTFYFDDIPVRIESNNKDIHNYLTRFLSPYFSRFGGQGTPPAFTFKISLCSDIPHGTFIRPILIRDSHSAKGRYSGTEEALDGKRIIHLGHSRIVFEEPTILSLRSNNMDDLKKYGRIVVRDVVQKEFEKRGGISLHASSVYDKHGNCICILGDKGSGKTTVLFEYMLRRGYSYGGLDRVMIKKIDHGFIAYGWPLLYNIGYGTLTRYQELENSRPLELLSSQQKDWGVDDKLVLEPYELPYKAIDKGSLSALLFPSMDLSLACSELRRATIDYARSSLAKCVCTPEDPNFVDWHKMVHINRDNSISRTSIMLDNIVNITPAYMLKWGRIIEKLP